MPSIPTDRAPTLPASLATLLDQVRARGFKLKASLLPLSAVLLLALGWTLRAIMDRRWDLPWTLRAFLLLLDVLVIGWLAYRWVVRPLAAYLSRRQAALLLERSVPELKTSLIAAVELTGDKANTPPESWPLVNQLLEDVTIRLGADDWANKLFDGRRLRPLLVTAALALLTALTLLVVHLPVSGLLLQRVLLSHQPLPNNTLVLSITKDLQVMAGDHVTLSARAQGTVPGTGKLRLTYDEGASELQEVHAGKEQGREDTFTYEVRNVRGSFTYRFELNDGVGSEHRVKAVIPPALKDIQFIQQYPAYTGLPETRMPTTGLKLLQGATLKIQAKATMPLSAATLEIEGTHSLDVRPFQISHADDQASALGLELTIPGQGWSTFTIKLKSTDDVSSMNDPVYRVQLVTDQPPQVAMLEPREERLTLLANDQLPVAFRITDDFGITTAGIRYRVFRPGLSDVNDSTETGYHEAPVPQGEKSLVHQWDWQLATILPPLTPGCRVSFWVEARDNNSATGPSVAKSVERNIEIVTEQQKRLELLELLGMRAKAIERLYNMQHETNERTDQSIR